MGLRLATITLMAVLGVPVAASFGQGKLPKGALTEEVGDASASESGADKPKVDQTGGDSATGDKAASDKAASDKAVGDTVGTDAVGGKDTTGKAAADKTAAKKRPKRRRSCFLDLADPPGGNVHFSADGGTAWMLLVADADGKPGKPGKKSGKQLKHSVGKARYVLYKISPKTKQGEPVLSLEHGVNAVLLAHGDPVDAVSLVAFRGRAAGCYEGPASMISVKLAKSDDDDDDAEIVKGTYQVVVQPNGFGLADMRKSQMLQIDPASFQTKLARKLPANERPLFFDPESKRLVSWYDDGSKRGLVAHADGAADSEPSRLEVKRGDRVLQNAGDFGVAHLMPPANAIEIMELKDWTDVAKPGRYKINVPPAYGIVSAGVQVNFKKHLALVQGANFLAKTRWQRLFIYDYRSAEPLTVVPVTNQQYINAAAIDPRGTYALVEMRDVGTRRTENVRLYDFATNAFADVKLTPPK